MLRKTSFTDYKYISLEDPDMILFATDDPRGFLSTYPKASKSLLHFTLRASNRLRIICLNYEVSVMIKDYCEIRGWA